MKKITRRAVLGELAAIAFSDFSKFVTVESDEERGQVMVITDTALLKSDARKAVAAAKMGTKGIEIKLYDKLRALEILGRVCGIFGGGDQEEQQALDQLRALFEKEEDFATDR